MPHLYTAFMPLLPNELVVSIIEELYNDDDSQGRIRALQNCALVARAWVRASQRGIFRSILLETSIENEPRIYQLVSLFDANPLLAAYVKRLDLANPGYTEFWEEDVVSVVNRLSDLHEISFSHLNWDEISPVLEENLLRLLRGPSLTKATFVNFRTNSFAHFASLLSNLTHLKSLRIGGRGWIRWSLAGSGEDSTAKQSVVPSRSIQLIDLELSGTLLGHFLAWFEQDSCPFEIQSLKVLRLGRNRTLSDYERATWMVQHAGQSLRELEIADIDAVHLGYAHNLRRLKLHDLYQDVSHTPAPQIKNLFRPVVNLNQRPYPLQSLTIQLCLHQYGPDDDPVQTHDWRQWTSVDKIFERDIFAALKEVSILFKYSSFTITTSKEKEVRELLRQVLPFLSSSGKLHYNFE